MPGKSGYTLSMSTSSCVLLSGCGAWLMLGCFQPLQHHRQMDCSKQMNCCDLFNGSKL